MNQHNGIVAGIDEAGRGPLAGPVIAAAVVFVPDFRLPGLADSKKLSASQRENLYIHITNDALDWSVGSADVSEIDEINILQASLLAMRRAVLGLKTLPELALVDGNQCPKLPCQTKTIVKGDQTVAVISAASVIAKVSRDRIMQTLDKQYPNYGFAKHKGYPTKAHLLALQNYGVSPIHRRSYAPVKRILNLVKS